jgi:pimeloyl-ACP methyl ester carboxylesterase
MVSAAKRKDAVSSSVFGIAVTAVNNIATAGSLSDFGLHCIRECAADTVVVFVHGILSSGETAWGSPSWPDLLADDQDLEKVGVYVVTYETGLRSRTYGIADVADYLREHLRLSKLLEKPKIVFVCHSMGGIVVRRFLVANQAELIAKQPSIGLFLVASPSLGSRDANMLSVLSFVLQHTQAAALRFSQANTSLDELHRDFRALLSSGKPSIEGRELTEDRPIAVKRWLGLWRQVVEPFAAGQYFYKRGFEPFKVPGSDHVSIVKPLYTGAIQHLMLKNFILGFIHPHNASLLAPVDEQETLKAYRAIAELHQGIARVMSKPVALGKLQHAIFETRQYIERRRRREPRDLEAERLLAKLWNDCGNALQKFDAGLASLCWIKGHGWADERLWTDPRFANLPVELDDMLQRLHEAMSRQADEMPTTVEESRKALVAMSKTLDDFDEAAPAMADVLKQPGLKTGPLHSITHRMTDKNTMEFLGLGRKVTVSDLVTLPADDRGTIEAFEEGMRELKRGFEAIIANGLRSQEDEDKLIEISSQMGTNLNFVLGIIENNFGVPLMDHYGAQRMIAEYAMQETQRRDAARKRAAMVGLDHSRLN